MKKENDVGILIYFTISMIVCIALMFIIALNY